ncbi:hypothetical protein [Kineococcus arenarius]|uniref:hypothetical protein n=1 Tax=unclassified Kineococcus TaxID=2621656 RepID=UPI003D7D867F
MTSPAVLAAAREVAAAQADVEFIEWAARLPADQRPADVPDAEVVAEALRVAEARLAEARRA